MAVQALYRKWRSQTFDEVIGQEHVTRTLRNALRDGRVAHAYLFSGPRGTGKTSTARLLAKAVNCLNDDIQARPDNTCEICQSINEGAFLDLIEIDAASNRGIDEIRDLRDKVHFAPSHASYKVYVVDEVHMLTTEAFNALLKTLEEPPPHVIFVLATTEPHKIPDTVLSRCQRFDFRRIPTHEIVDRLTYILQQEGYAAEPAALEMIARSAEGCMRDAISLMDQLLSYGSELITEAQVRSVRGTISGQAIADFVQALSDGNAAQGLVLINQLAAEGVDLRQLALQLVAYLRSVLVACVATQQVAEILVDLSPEHLALVKMQSAGFGSSALSSSIRVLNQAASEMRDAAQPQLTLELAWLEALEPIIQATTPAGQETVDAAQQARGGWGDSSRIGSHVVPPPSIQQLSPGADAAKPSAAPVPKGSPETSILPRPVTPIPDEQVVEALRANWTALLQAAENARGGSLRGALRTLRNVVASGSDVYFAFENEFSRSTVDRPANKLALQDLIGQLLGRPVNLHCQVGTAGVAGEPARKRVGDPPIAEDSSPVADITDDPVVEHALHNLGAVKGVVSNKR